MQDQLDGCKTLEKEAFSYNIIGTQVRRHSKNLVNAPKSGSQAVYQGASLKMYLYITKLRTSESPPQSGLQQLKEQYLLLLLIL